MWHLNGIWNINFVNNNEILVVEKYTLLANISNRLKMELEIKFSSRT